MIRGTVARILQDFGQGRGVVSVETPEGSAKAIGPVTALSPGQAVELQGYWQTHPRFGKQFFVTDAKPGQVQPGPGLVKWLARIDGIGPKTARAITGHLGTDCLETIKDRPEKLEEIDGIGKAKAKAISEAVKARSIKDELWEDLVNAGVDTAAISRVISRYGDKAADIVRRHPFTLLGTHGIGWKTVDAIAQAGGTPPASPARIRAGVLETLKQASKSGGHCYLPVSTLLKGERGKVTGAARLLSLKADTISRRFEEIERSGALVNVDGAVFPADLHRAETATASLLSALASAQVEEIDTAPAEDPKGEIEFSTSQAEAIHTSTNAPVTIITGGPGTGKTTITRTIAELYSSAGLSVELAAPTGRAAKRLSEATGYKAQTIHRLLEYAPHLGFQRHRHNQLTCQVLIVDEFSMVDVRLAARLLDAIPQGCRLVIVGDVDQLPSVGPGAVLEDLINSDKLPVIRLQEVFRQARGSRIIGAAHNFAKGHPVAYPEPGEESDFFFYRRNDPSDIKQAVGEFLLRHIPRRFGLDPIRDVMILTPQNQGPLGTKEINLHLQKLINPDGQSLGGRTVRVGDRVMQIKNNYTLEVFNGDVGTCTDWNPAEKQARVDFGDRTVTYGREHLRGLVLAYCATTHKSQGSEFPAVIGIVHSSHQWMLRRKLVYTMITRAKRLLVLIGQRQALEVASKNTRDSERYTRLSWVLQDPPDDAPPLRGNDTIEDRIYTCDACMHTFPADSPQVYKCPECGKSDQIRELTEDED